MKKSCNLLAASLSSIVFYGASIAGATPLGVATDYNLFVFNDLGPVSSDAEGNIAVGRDAIINAGYSVGSLLGAQAKLVVNGNLNWSTTGSVGNGLGSIYVQGTDNLPPYSVSRANVYHTQDLVDFHTAQRDLTQSSAGWSQLAANGTKTAEGGALTLHGSDPDLNVFSLTTTDLLRSNMSSFTFDVPEGSTVLINVAGQTAQMENFGFYTTQGSEATLKRNILSNFYQATAISLAGCEFWGSVLAPYADFDFIGGDMDGTLIANSARGGGELHHYTFQGDLPNVPEPATLITLVLGSAVFPVKRKRAV